MQATRDTSIAIFDPAGKQSITKKLISIEKKFKLVSTAADELYKQDSKFADKLYIITKKVEFYNIMNFSGAYLRNIPVTDNMGKASNLFEAFDENGNIKEGWVLSNKKSNDDFLFDVNVALNKLI